MAPPPFLKNLSDRQLAATNSHWKLPPCHKPIEALEHFLNSQQLEPRQTHTVQLKHTRKMAAETAVLALLPAKSPFLLFYVWCCHSQIAALYILLECQVLICDDSWLFFPFFFILICIFIVNLLSDRTINCKMRTLFCSVKVWQSLWASPWHRIRKIIVLLGMHGIIVQKIDTALCVL